MFDLILMIFYMKTFNEMDSHKEYCTMVHSKDDVLAEIDITIDQLLENAKVLKKIASKECYLDEISALEKTQESLIAHLIHMDEILKKKDKASQQQPLLASKVHDKLGRSGYLNQTSSKPEYSMPESHAPKKPKIHKRKVLSQQQN